MRGLGEFLEKRLCDINEELEKLEQAGEQIRENLKNLEHRAVSISGAAMEIRILQEEIGRIKKEQAVCSLNPDDN